MSGNVWEWVQDMYDKNAYGSHNRDNPVNTGGGPHRVNRGGDWSRAAGYARCANRGAVVPGRRYGRLGFRLLRK